jgi:hypothetical protein
MVCCLFLSEGTVHLHQSSKIIGQKEVEQIYIQTNTFPHFTLFYKYLELFFRIRICSVLLIRISNDFDNVDLQNLQKK